MKKEEFIKMVMNDFLKSYGWESENKEKIMWGHFSIHQILNLINNCYNEGRERTFKDILKNIETLKELKEKEVKK